MTEKKPINVEAQRISRITDEYAAKLQVLSMLSSDFFADLKIKKTEEELSTIFGKECGKLLFDEAVCEDKFASVNMKVNTYMEPIDSEEFNSLERREARQNAQGIKGNILKLVRFFSKKPMQDKLNKEFRDISKVNDISNFSETFEDLRKLWAEKLKTPLEEANNIKQQLDILRSKTQSLEGMVKKKDEAYSKAKDNNKDQKAQLKREQDALDESAQAKNSSKRTREGDLQQTANRIKEEAEQKHQDKIKFLQAEILKLKEQLMNDKEQHQKEETQLNSAYDSADTNYLNNLDQYDQEMRDKHEKIAQKRKECDQFTGELAGLQEEYKQRLEEKRKRDEIKAMVDKLEDERQRILDQEMRAAEWIQAHWLGMQARKDKDKARKNNRKGKKRGKK